MDINYSTILDAKENAAIKKKKKKKKRLKKFALLAEVRDNKFKIRLNLKIPV